MKTFINEVEENEMIDIGGFVPERPEPVVVLLAGSIPKMEKDVLIVALHLGGVVLEHGGHVVRGELLRGVRDEKRSLTDSAITDYIEGPSLESPTHYNKSKMEGKVPTTSLMRVAPAMF